MSWKTEVCNKEENYIKTQKYKVQKYFLTKLVTWFEQVALWSAITRSAIELNELIKEGHKDYLYTRNFGYNFFRPVAMGAKDRWQLRNETVRQLQNQSIHFLYANHELSDPKVLSTKYIQFTAFFNLQRWQINKPMV